MNHPLIKYGKAVLLANNNLTDENQITIEHILKEIEICKNKLQLKPIENIDESKTKIKFEYCVDKEKKKKDNYFTSPHVLNKNINTIFEYINETKEKLKKSTINDFTNKIDKKITKTAFPLSSEFLGFSFNGNVNRNNFQLKEIDIYFTLIAIITDLKPSINKLIENTKKDYANFCLIPDLEINDLVNFIKIFKIINEQKNTSELFYSKVAIKKNKIEVYRPYILNGNYPFQPKSFYLNEFSLLTNLSEFIKKAEYSQLAKKVLKSFKNNQLYIINFGDAKTIKFNHILIEIALEGNLKTIIDSLYYTELYIGKRNNKENNELKKSIEEKYKQFDFFTKRFLLFFSKQSFFNFISIRGEYSNNTLILFKNFFKNIFMINNEIIQSAKIYGQWVNKQLYWLAKNESKNSSIDEIRKVKTKYLIQLESKIFNAKKALDLAAQLQTIVGRLFETEPPFEANLILETLCAEPDKLDDIKNLLVIFIRTRSIEEGNKINNSTSNDLESEPVDENTENEDLSNI